MPSSSHRPFNQIRISYRWMDIVRQILQYEKWVVSVSQGLSPEPNSHTINNTSDTSPFCLKWNRIPLVFRITTFSIYSFFIHIFLSFFSYIGFFHFTALLLYYTPLSFVQFPHFHCFRAFKETNEWTFCNIILHYVVIKCEVNVVLTIRRDTNEISFLHSL